MSLLASLLLSAALFVRPDAGLRLYNPYPFAAEATLTCAESAQVLRIEPGAFTDVPEAAQCMSLDGLFPLTAIETRGANMQRALQADAECGDTIVFAPLFACASGTGVAGVPVTDGATYSWSAEGASIVDGAGTSRVSLAFGAAGNVKLTCVITTKECSRLATAVIAVREPIAAAQLTVPQIANTGEPLTVTWTYAAGSPTSQLLTGDALEEPVALPGTARSYTFTPARTGTRTLEVHGSYFAAMSDTARRGKRRAAGRSVASASDCTTVSASRTLDVRGCNVVIARINAPASVDAGATFEARVSLETGEEAQWTVENATVVDTSPSVGKATLRAGETGEVRMSVRIVRGACTRSASAVASIVPAAKHCDVSPAATLTYVSHGCSGAVVKATFTGTPPFRGTWSDETTFHTTQSSIQHTFEKAGTYGITGFRDLGCIGIVSGVPRVDSLRGTVRLDVVGGPCTTGKLVAKLTGTPPFTFRWSHPWPQGEWVTTSEREVVRQLEPGQTGPWKIDGMSDSVCAEQAVSNSIRIDDPPEVDVWPGPVCSINDFEQPALSISAGGLPPYSVTWTDGVVTTSTTSNYFLRYVPRPTAPLVTYTIASATASGCLAKLGNRTATVTNRQMPQIDRAGLDPLVCPNEIATLTLRKVPPPEATIVWTVPGGEILSGQGTPTITFRPTSETDSLIRVEASYPDGACGTYDQALTRFYGMPEPQDFEVQPTTIPPGQKATVSFIIDRDITSRSLSISPGSRGNELGPIDCLDGVCKATFRDATGPGTVTFELKSSGDCRTTPQSLFTTLTIQ